MKKELQHIYIYKQEKQSATTLNKWSSKTHRGLPSTSVNALKRLTHHFHFHFQPLSLLRPAETLFVVLKLFHLGNSKP